MDLTPYVDSLQDGLTAAAAAGTDATRETARLLATALDPAVRLCLVDALSAMAAEVTAAGDLGAVEIRMHGREPQVVVSTAMAVPVPTAPLAEDDGEGTTARVTLRLPEALKGQAEAAAAAEGISVNAWLVRAVAAGARPTGARGTGATTNDRWSGRSISGFARS